MTNAARKPVANFVALAIVAFLLYGCGQRGPLFLPDEAPTEVKESPETTPAPPPADNPAPEEGKDTERKPDEKPR